MASKRRRAENGGKQGLTSGRATSNEQRIEHLRSGFAKFRRANRAQTRLEFGDNSPKSAERI